MTKTNISLEQQVQLHLNNLQKNPNSYEDNFNLATILVQTSNPFSAISFLKNAINIKPDYFAMFALALSFHDSGLIDDAMGLAESLLKILPDGHPTKELTYLLLMTGSASCLSYDQERILKLSKEFNQKYFKVNKKSPKIKPLIGRKIKIGLVSPDLHTHPVGIYLASFLEYFNQDEFEIYAYYNSTCADKVSEKIKESCVKWIDTKQIMDSDLVRIIKDDEIDLILDLAGYTRGNRMSVLAEKPAPVNVAWMGYYNTTGSDVIDYILADENLIPKPEDKFYSEKVYRLPKAYMPTELFGMDLKPSLEPPFKKNGYITFGTLNHVRKINKDVIAIWAQILKQVPESKLLIKGIMLNDQELQMYLRAKFKENGVDPNSILIEGKCSRDEAISTYNLIDIALDTFSFGGGLTSIENLLMSTPLVTWHGDRFMCRVSSSALKQIGCEELIAYNLDDYVKIAVDLANDKERILEYKSCLREKMLNSPVNAKNFAEDFQQALKEIMKNESDI